MSSIKNMLNAPYECYKNERYLEPSHRINKQNAKYLLLTLKHIFEQNGIEFMLAYGTLLGAIREHDFIAQDVDMDAMMWGRDVQKALDLAPELEKYDIHLHCYVLPWIFTYEYKGETCDFEAIYETKWPWNRWFFLTHEMYIPKLYFTTTEKIIFLEETFTVPAQAENLLAYHYGKDWRIPQSKKPRYESYVFFWRYAHRFVQRCIRYAKRHWLQKK